MTTEPIADVRLSHPTLCFFHIADLDGHCSGALVKNQYPDCKMIPFDYGWEFPWTKYKWENEIVWMIDISLPFDQMEQLSIITKEFHWIDHHAKSIADAEDSLNRGKFNAQGIFSNGKAACELTWQYIYPNDPMPFFVFLIGRFDVWDHESHSFVVPFDYGAKQYITDPSKEPTIWTGLLNSITSLEVTRKIVEEGQIVQRYVNNQDNKLVRSGAFTIEIDGLKCIAINVPNTSEVKPTTKIFDLVTNKDKYDAALMFGYIGPEHKWKFSLHALRKDLNVLDTVIKMGGGGHEGAGSWKSKTISIDFTSQSNTLKN